MPSAEEIVRFARRDWARVDASKRAHWAGLGADGRFALAASLWAHARETLPAWPVAESRAEDLAHHVELKRKLDAIAHALGRR